MLWKIKNWLLRLTEPWREEQAALDLEWKVFAKKHNAAGHRPQCWHPGMEPDPMEKVALVDAREVDPNYLRDQFAEAHAEQAEEVAIRKANRDISAVEKAENLRFSNRKGAVEED
jgi:hypothetical protein